MRFGQHAPADYHGAEYRVCAVGRTNAAIPHRFFRLSAKLLSEREAGSLSLLVGKMRLRPGEQLARLLDGFRDQNIEIALPAEDISLGHGGDVQTVSGRVQAHEWVGRDLQIVVMVDGSLVRLRTRQRLDLRIGGRLVEVLAQHSIPTRASLSSTAQMRADHAVQFSKAL